MNPKDILMIKDSEKTTWEDELNLLKALRREGYELDVFISKEDKDITILNKRSRVGTKIKIVNFNDTILERIKGDIMSIGYSLHIDKSWKDDYRDVVQSMKEHERMEKMWKKRWWK